MSGAIEYARLHGVEHEYFDIDEDELLRELCSSVFDDETPCQRPQEN